MRIAILGTGTMGTTLGTAFAAAGHTVVYGSRSPGSSRDLPGDVVDHAAAIAEGDLVVSALLASSTLDTLGPLSDALDGKVLLDIGNAVDETMELLYPDSSLGEQLQALLPGTKVVKSLNTLPGALAVAPGTLTDPGVVFLSGDDADAKALVSDLVGELGWPADARIDLGGIQTARATERYFTLFVALMGHFRGAPFNIALSR
jgi:hypothetical protein